MAAAEVLFAYQMAMDYGQIIGLIVVGVLVDVVGFRRALMASAVVAATGLGVWLPAREILARPGAGEGRE